MPESAPAAGALRARRFAGWVALIVLIIALDQLTKFIVLASIRPGEVIEVTSFFKLVLGFNPGAAFSFLADHSGWQRWFFIVLAFGVSGWLCALLYRDPFQRLPALAYALIVGGALGNVIDRFLFPGVVDFLYFHYDRWGWPAFNVADSAITVGVVVLLVAAFFPARTSSTGASIS